MNQKKCGDDSKDCSAIVLSGGGALGALQAGALQVLVEAGVRPDLLVGTSIGAMNAVCLAVYGFTPAGVRQLKKNWLEAARTRLLPGWNMRTNISDWMAYFRGGYGNRIRDFLISCGIEPDLKFGQLTGQKVILVASDLITGERVLYGLDPEQTLLEGMLASAAIPPWVYPLQVREYYLVDGGLVSNLPVETAMDQGASTIITLELSYSLNESLKKHGFRPFISRVLNTVEKRQSELELALALTRGIPVFRIPLVAEEKYTFWDFRHSKDLMDIGYQLARGEVCSPAGETFFAKIQNINLSADFS